MTFQLPNCKKMLSVGLLVLLLAMPALATQTLFLETHDCQLGANGIGT
jgi:hypothetical protein